MPVSERERTAIANIAGWRNTAPAQFAEELASLSLETHRIADPYSYLITAKGELFSPTARCLIKDTIDDKTSLLGRLEYQAVLVTEQWVANNNEGVSIWVSPPKKGIYPTSKIIVQEIVHEGGVKKLFNRAIVLDFNEEQCMRFAWNLTSFSHNKPIFRDLDEIRAIPLVLNTQNKSWIDILEKLIDVPKVWAMIRNGEDKQYKKETLRQAVIVQKQFFTDSRLSYSDEAKIAVMQMLGSKSGSCPPRSGTQGRTAFQAIAGSAVTVGSGGGLVESDQYGSLEFECPKCKKTNTRPKGQLIPNCQHCGQDVRC